MKNNVIPQPARLQTWTVKLDVASTERLARAKALGLSPDEIISECIRKGLARPTPASKTCNRVNLTPRQWKYARQRATEMNATVDAYFDWLVQCDRERIARGKQGSRGNGGNARETPPDVQPLSGLM